MESFAASARAPPFARHAVYATSAAKVTRFSLSYCKLERTSCGEPALCSIQSTGSTRPHLAPAVRAVSELDSPEQVSRKGAARNQQPQLDRRHLLVGSSLITASTGLENAPAGAAPNSPAPATELPEKASWPGWGIGTEQISLAVFLGAAYVCLCLLIPALSLAGQSQTAGGLFKLNFFLQEDPSSSFFVVPAMAGYGGNFGALDVIDQAITVSPEATSTQIGRAKGLAVFANNANVPSPELVWTAVFNDCRPGGYGNSSLSFRGYNALAQEEREVAIVGGTGQFRLAKGWAIIRTFSRNRETRVATTNITVFVQAGSEADTSPSSYKPW